MRSKPNRVYTKEHREARLIWFRRLESRKQAALGTLFRQSTPLCAKVGRQWIEASTGPVP